MRAELALGTDPSEVTRLNAWLDDAFAKAGLVEPLRNDMKLCLNEAVANVMLYAFADQPDPAIRVAIAVEADAVEAELFDNGTPFNPLDRPKKAKYTDIDSAVPGGFGIQLIRETASHTEYRRDGEWNRLHLVCGVRAMTESP